MSAPGPHSSDALLAGVRLRIVRHLRWKADQDKSVAYRLAQIGVLGWIVVLPTLAGMFIGRWCDRGFHSGLFWTAPLMLIGLALGCWLAWKWVQEA